MSDEEKYIMACRYAIMEMIEKGSSSLALGIGSKNQTVVQWKDVLTWLGDGLKKIRKGE